MNDFMCAISRVLRNIKSVFAARVFAELEQAFVGDFGSGFRGDVVRKVHLELTADFQIVGGRGHAHRVVQPLNSVLEGGANSPLGPPNCWRSTFPKRGLGVSMCTVYIHSFTW
jgi:hypothetical protein